MAASFVGVNVESVRVYSIYLFPNDQYDDFLKDFDELKECIRYTKGEVLVAGDFNCKSPEWGSKKLDRRGETLSEMIARLDLVIINEGAERTFRRGNKKSCVDVTPATERVASRTTGWRVSENESLSDHQYIEIITIGDSVLRTPTTTAKAGGWVLQKLNKIELRKSLEEEKRHRRLQQIAQQMDMEVLVEYAVATITAACDAAMPRLRKFQGRRQPVYWRTPEITKLRKMCLVARRKYQREIRREHEASLKEEYKTAKKELRRAIKQSKRKCWIHLCRSVEEDPWDLPYRLVRKRLIGRNQTPGLTCPERVNEIVAALFPAHSK